jgi:hypothetical protein
MGQASAAFVLRIFGILETWLERKARLELLFEMLINLAS